MILSNHHRRKVPEYYRYMYLDGYSPQEIVWSLHQKMIREYQERQHKEDVDTVDIRIRSEVKVK